MNEKDTPFKEYGKAVPGCLRAVAPKCPFVAVIPSITVEDKSGIKNLADCFVHVANINTTYYIDDKKRSTKIWAGPIEAEGYGRAENSLGLRSQLLFDFEENVGVYYNATGDYRIFDLRTEDEPGPAPREDENQQEEPGEDEPGNDEPGNDEPGNGDQVIVVPR